MKHNFPGRLVGALKMLACFSFVVLTGCGSGGNSYTIGGTVSGLSGTVVLQNNLADDLQVTADGAFTFATSIADGAAYSVTVLTQPGSQTCTVANGSGTVSGADVTGVTVTCAANAYTIGGTLSGLSGTVVLQNNLADDLQITADGAFTFATALADGAAYSVTILTQPGGQTCTVSSGSGTVSGANVTDITVSCAINPLKIFVTAATSNGNLGGVTGADEKCMSDEVYPGTGTYKAMLIADPTRIACTTASCSGGASEHTDWVLSANRDYVRFDGTTAIATTNASGIFVFPITNSLAASNSNIWTGLASDWTVGVNSCREWTNGTDGKSGSFGTTMATDSQAIAKGTLGCDNTSPILCVEQ